MWDSVSLNTLHVIGMGVFDRAVTCVAFSKSVSGLASGLLRLWSEVQSATDWWSLFNDFFSSQNGGTFLCAVDDANDHLLSVWDWQKEKQLADVKVP